MCVLGGQRRSWRCLLCSGYELPLIINTKGFFEFLWAEERLNIVNSFAAKCVMINSMLRWV